MTTDPESTKSGTDTTRDTYRRKREAQLRELGARVDRWEEKLRKAAAEGEVRYREELEEIRSKLEIARVRLSLLGDAGEAAWQEIRDGLDDAVKDLRTAVGEAASKFE